jgi:hypothetical protein
MATPQIEPSTKKAFSFPKGAASKTAASAKTAKQKPEAKAAPKRKAKAATSAQPVAKKTEAPKKAAAPKTSAPAADIDPATKTNAKTKTKAEPKVKRVKKEKVVRDSFTMPKSDYAKLASLKQKCQDNGLRVKKSELLRAALIMLDAAPEKRIVAAIKALEAVKTGRPANA